MCFKISRGRFIYVLFFSLGLSLSLTAFANKSAPATDPISDSETAPVQVAESHPPLAGQDQQATPQHVAHYVELLKSPSRETREQAIDQIKSIARSALSLGMIGLRKSEKQTFDLSELFSEEVQNKLLDFFENPIHKNWHEKYDLVNNWFWFPLLNDGSPFSVDYDPVVGIFRWLAYNQVLSPTVEERLFKLAFKEPSPLFENAQWPIKRSSLMLLIQRSSAITLLSAHKKTETIEKVVDYLLESPYSHHWDIATRILETVKLNKPTKDRLIDHFFHPHKKRRAYIHRVLQSQTLSVSDIKFILSPFGDIRPILESPLAPNTIHLGRHQKIAEKFLIKKALQEGYHQEKLSKEAKVAIARRFALAPHPAYARILENIPNDDMPELAKSKLTALSDQAQRRYRHTALRIINGKQRHRFLRRCAQGFSL